MVAGEQEFLRRFPAHIKVEFVELTSGKSSSSDELNLRKERESQAVLAALREREFLVVLDESGHSFSSKKFSSWLEQRMLNGDSQIVFAIGGSYGFSESIKARADLVMSLSALTFPYQICRLLLVEQLYRAYSIIEGQPYHKI